jgi:hypothetical protein
MNKDMNKDILQNIKNKYPTLQEFGIDCMNCKVYGSHDSKDFGMCGNCCICRRKHNVDLTRKKTVSRINKNIFFILFK